MTSRTTSTVRAHPIGRNAAAAIALAMVVLALYWPVLDTYFVADDFAYLWAISSAHSPSVIFSALAERYFRPAVVALYYLNYSSSGLAPLTYHVTVVIVHGAAAWMLYVFLSQRPFFMRPQSAFLAALLFAVFGGHAEAVTWIGGAADPLLTLFVLSMLVCYARLQEAARPAALSIAIWVAYLCALLSKESAGIAPALLLLTLCSQPSWWLRKTALRRSAIVGLGLCAVTVGYLVVRHHVLGFTFVRLEGLGMASSIVHNFRPFFVRSVLPQGDFLVFIYRYSGDLALLFLLTVLALRGVWRPHLRAATTLYCAVWIALAPVLPLSIGIEAPQSERLIYLASAFGCGLMVAMLDALLAVASSTIAIGALVLWNSFCLLSHNASWIQAASITRAHTDSYAAMAGSLTTVGKPIFVLNLVDNVDGAYVWRRGFHEALRLVTETEYASAVDRTIVVSVIETSGRGRARAERVDSRTFTLDLDDASLVAPPPDSSWFETQTSSGTGLRLRFNPSANQALVLYMTPERIERVGTIAAGPAAPIGYIDVPAGSTTCEGELVELRGWAVHDVGISHVVIVFEASDRHIELARARHFDRPDVRAALPSFPDSDSAGWAAAVPCRRLRQLTNASVARLRVVAVSADGIHAAVGERDITVR